MKRYILPIGAVLVLVVILVGIFFAALNKSNENSNIDTTTQTTPTVVNNGLAETPTPTTFSTFKNGEYIGDPFTTEYGTTQVKVIVSGDKITDIQILVSPNNESRSSQISDYSLPILKQEAIQKQSASVNAVSGATDTSRSFMRSMSSALSKAI